MMQQNNSKYTYTAIFLHWVIAIFILVMVGLGWYMEDLPKGPDRSWFFATHKSIGLTVFLLVSVRIVWRLSHRPPEWPDTMPPWRQYLARRAHLLFYVLMCLQPISGYLSSSFSGYKTKYFGIPLPHWGWKDEMLNELFSEVHEINSILLVSLIVAHVLGALSHAVRPGDGVFRRILP